MANVSIPDIKDRLALIASGITGVRRSDAMAPRVITEIDCPYVAIGAGAAVDTPFGPDVVLIDREFTLELYVARISAGIDGELERQVESFLETVKNGFRIRPRLNGLTGIRQVSITGDSGVTVMLWNKTEFLGSVITLSVQYLQGVTYAAGN